MEDDKIEMVCPECGAMLAIPKVIADQRLTCRECRKEVIFIPVAKKTIQKVQPPKESPETITEKPLLSDTKSCPFCGETILAVAKKCKHCGEFLDKIDNPQSTSNPPNTKDESKSESSMSSPKTGERKEGEKKQHKGIAAFTLLMIFSTLSLYMYSCMNSLSESAKNHANTPPSPESIESEKKHHAKIEAECAVENLLKSPSTAKFAYTDSELSVKNIGEGKYRVVGYVDSQNGFGAIVRTYYIVILQNDGDNWTVVGNPILRQQ